MEEKGFVTLSASKTKLVTLHPHRADTNFSSHNKRFYSQWGPFFERLFGIKFLPDFKWNPYIGSTAKETCTTSKSTWLLFPCSIVIRARSDLKWRTGFISGWSCPILTSDSKAYNRQIGDFEERVTTSKLLLSPGQSWHSPSYGQIVKLQTKTKYYESIRIHFYSKFTSNTCYIVKWPRIPIYSKMTNNTILKQNDISSVCVIRRKIIFYEFV